MNKKGWIGILTVIMLGVVISVILYSYVLPLPWKETMGEQQAAILNAYSVGEQARVYIKDAAEISALKAAYDLAEDCEPSFGEYSTKSDTRSKCPVSASTEDFEDRFLFYFEQYLESFELPSYAEDDFYTLYDVVDYDLDITITDKIVIIGYPVVEIYTFTEISDEDEEVEVEYEYESAIEISSETYNFDYILDPYFKVEVEL